jgi:nitrogen fixation protein NifU and related proteins
MSDLYRDIVLDHNRAPRHRGALVAPTHAADGVNALCGDRLRIELRVESGRIVQFGFDGESCAIAIATSSLLGELALGRTPEMLATMHETFAAVVRGDVAEQPGLDGLNALAELKHYPARRKCALLPWATLRAALEGVSETTTEKDAP